MRMRLSMAVMAALVVTAGLMPSVLTAPADAQQQMDTYVIPRISMEERNS